LVLVDNCSSHSLKRDLVLSNVRVEFFPAKTTSANQPMDMGIIRSVKAGYRKRLLEKIIRSLSGTREMPKIGIDTAIYLLAASWDSVSTSTIENCWRKAGFQHGETDEVEFDGCEEAEPEEFDRLMAEALGLMPHGEDMAATGDDYISADDNLATQAPADMGAICDGLQPDAEEEGGSEDEDDEEPPVITAAVAIRYAHQLKRFLQTLPDVPVEMQLTLQKMESLFEENRSKALKQTNIEDFFA
jgi:hypothetical protein